MRHELRLFFVALQFLTRLPAPAWVGRDGWQPEWLNRAVRHFPLVGAAVGLLAGAVAYGAYQLWPPWVAATLAVAATLWLTAAFHEDGLADTFDALLGAAPRERALAIMKDSRIGTYGAAALGLGLLLRVALLAELLARDPLLAAAACVAAHAGARACAVTLMAALPYAGDEAHAKAKPLARAVRGADAGWAIAIGVLALVLALVPALAAVQQASPAPAVASVAAAGVLALGTLVLVLRAWLLRRLGGYTGDALGACEQLGEIALWLVFVAMWAR
ncbi:MAG: adenosylcobinamide-GDP ribazoletransferase [Ideonella sp.]|nr:adenosylcobinamide-GDP ribazoletransferase [Ideonella sp.]